MIGRWTVVNAVLVLIVLALAGQIGLTWMRSRPALPAVEREEGEARERRRPARRPRAAAEPQEMVAMITEQDLFDPSRKAAGQAGSDTGTEIAEDETPPPPPGVTVVGVRLLGEDREAFVRDTSKNEQRRVRLGDDVGGYTVQEIRDTSIVLEASNGNRVTLWLSLVPSGGLVQSARRNGQPSTAAGNQAVRRTTPPQRAGRASPAEQRAERRQRRRRPAARARGGRYRQEPKPSPGSPQLPDGVRERLERLRQGS